MREIKNFFIEIFQVTFFALLITIPIRIFLFQPFLVQGISMEPNFKEKDYLIVDEISKRFSEFKRGEIIVFTSPYKKKLIKRIVGLPGEEIEIEDGKIKINGEILNEESYLGQTPFTKGNVKIKLGKDEYFVLGDNRNFSLDSRNFGPIKRKDIIGRVFIKIRFSSIFNYFQKLFPWQN